MSRDLSRRWLPGWARCFRALTRCSSRTAVSPRSTVSPTARSERSWLSEPLPALVDFDARQLSRNSHGIEDGVWVSADTLEWLRSEGFRTSAAASPPEAGS